MSPIAKARTSRNGRDGADKSSLAREAVFPSGTPALWADAPNPKQTPVFYSRIFDIS
ncbi:MAG: hypothetical protein UV75_C0003G0058 [Candidatus Giovannonibacteria bacterium GW2011_GWA1_43_15]|nr:MAG: hypothetical protein UV75_C0003G0058 [Candidatus Giovannonibacteria bacterium GW2011_GWA1_43_15]